MTVGTEVPRLLHRSATRLDDRGRHEYAFWSTSERPGREFVMVSVEPQVSSELCRMTGSAHGTLRRGDGGNNVLF